MYRVAFDLNRHEILRLWGIELPANQTAERALWQRLARELVGTP